MEEKIRQIEDALERINAILDGPYRLAYVQYARLRPAPQNARRMTSDMFARLTENIAKDKQLASLPLCWKNENGSFQIMSGHHRVRAAVKAGIEWGLILYTDAKLSDEERIAIQLSHNTLSGTDDVQLLMQLVAQMETPEVIQYSGVDLTPLQPEIPDALPPMSEARLALAPVTFYLTDPEVQTLEDFIETYNSSPVKEGGKGYWVDAGVWSEFMEELQKLAERHDLKSGNAALSQAIVLMRAEQNATEEG